MGGDGFDDSAHGPDSTLISPALAAAPKRSKSRSRAVKADRERRLANNALNRSDEDVLYIGQQRKVTLKTALHLPGGKYGYCDRSQPMQESAEEQREQHQSCRDQGTRNHDADVGDEVGLDPTQQRKREHEGADQQRQDALEHAVAYHSRMYRAENVPVAIWTTSTVTVTTNPVSAAIAPMIADRTVLAVEAEYCH